MRSWATGWADEFLEGIMGGVEGVYFGVELDDGDFVFRRRIGGAGFGWRHCGSGAVGDGVADNMSILGDLEDDDLYSLLRYVN